MPSTNTPLTGNIRTLSAELLNLADAIDQYSKMQRVRWSDRDDTGYTANHALFDAKCLREDYSDLLPNPPDDPTAWRGALFRQLQNAAIAGDEVVAVLSHAGYGRGASE